MKHCKHLLSLLMAVVMIFSLIPATVFASTSAAEPAPSEGAVTAYLSMSDDAGFLKDTNGEAVALRELTVPYFDLKNYGLEDFYFQSEDYDVGSLKPENADPAVYKGTVTVLHMMIYATEVLKFGVAPEEAGQGYLKKNNLMEKNFMPTGNPGSLFLEGIWDMDLNLNYYVNHAFPMATTGFGSTMDQIRLRDGDVITLGHFTSWSFFMDSRAPFNHLEVNQNADVATLPGTENLSLQVVHDGGGVSGEPTTYNNIDYPVDVYAADAQKKPDGDVTTWTKVGTTDATGKLTIDSAQELVDKVNSNNILLAVPGQVGADHPDEICCAPAAFRLHVDKIVDPNQEAADPVIKLITDLPDVDNITKDDAAAVKTARDAYDKLTAEQQALVTNRDKLTAVVAKLADMMQPVPVDAYWPNFRGSDSNMAIVDVKTPVSPDTTELKWNVKKGTGWAAAPSPMIIVDDSLVVMVGSDIYKLDLSDGHELAHGKMVANIGFGIVIPTYGDGMIFCPLSNGRVQAFDANTLESLWVYQDAKKGQPNCPITYSDGMIYTGFWNSEKKDANYVGINVRDEDPLTTNEAKEAAWTKTAKGGYYWAGSVVVGDAVIFGTDDGTSGTTGKDGHLYSLNKKTGEVISDLTGVLTGDQRSSIAYSADKGRIYFTTKGGYLYSAAVDATTGVISDLKESKLNANQSTSTPVVYGDQVYLCCGTGVGGSGTNSFVVADANTLKELYAVPMQGYPQCSPMVSTAYMETEGKLYFYLTYNSEPGGITLIKVDPTKPTADGAELVELYDAKGFEQYCICSVICDAKGTLYYKNDSCNILAVGTNADKAAAKAVDEKIVAIGDVTLQSEEAIKAARDAYDVLTPDQQALVKNLETLTAAEAKLAQLQKEAEENAAAAKAVDDKIAAIGDVTLQSEEAIKAARDAYDALTPAQQKLVKNLETLTAAEAKFAQLQKEAEENAAAAKAVDEKIAAIGDVTLQSEEAIKAARDAYDALTPAQQKLVKNLETLTAAEAKLAQLQKEAEDNAAAAKAVDEKIAAIGDVTLQSEEAIKAARDAYDALTPAQQKLVKNLETLTAAEAKLAQLQKEATENAAAAKAVDEKIAAIGDVTLQSEEAIKAARDAYDALTPAQQKLVKNLETLTAAEAELAQLQEQKPVTPPTGDSFDGAVYALLMLLSAAAAAVVLRKKEI